MENTHTTFEVPASIRREAQQIFVMILIFVALYAEPVSCVPVDKTILKIPAFGRIAQLGSMYDARTDSFNGLNIFKSNLPTTLTTTMQTPRITREFQIITKESNKFNLLGVDLETAASIQTGIIQPEGAASYLSGDMTSSKGVTGIFLQTFQTAEQTLPIFQNELQNYFNTDARIYPSATHVVTSISWGGSIAVKFIDTLSSKRSSIQSSNILNQEFKKLKRTSEDIGRQPSTFEMYLTSDVSLQNALPNTLREVRGQINHVRDSIKIINSGLGVPLKFTLTPISVFKNYLNVTTVTEITAHKLDENNLDNYLNIIDDNKLATDALIIFEDNSNCVSKELHHEIEKLHKSFNTADKNFKIEFKNILLGVKSGAFNNSALSQVLQNYIGQEFSPQNVRATLSLNEQAQQKVEFCSQLNDEYPDIEYFGSAPNLISKIYKNHNKPTYVLFTKSEFTENDRVSYEDNLNIFFNLLYKPSNSLFIVDCDFSYTQCDSINGTVIKQIRHGNYTLDDVRMEIKITEIQNKTKIVECNKESGFTGALCVSTIIKTSTKSKPEILSGNKKKREGSQRAINVVGGNTANPNEFPFQVLILRNSTGVHCGGSILNANFILTAAHCLYDYDENEYKTWTIVAGDHNWQQDEGTEQRRKIRRVHIHRQYIPIAEVNDIAIVQLDRPLQLSTKVQPILLPDADYEASGNAVLTGWGRLQSGGTNPLVLQKVTVPIVDRADCVEAYEEDQVFVSVKMLCAGHLIVGGVDACQGDSGGPLSVQLSNGSSMLVGVVSGGIGCARPEYPGIYMQVSKYVHWIHDALTNFGCSGVIDLPEPGKFALFEYKSAETYSNNEQCVWTLHSLAGGNRHWSTLKVTLIVDGLQSCCDKVSFLSLSRYADLISKPLSSMVPEVSGAEWHFLSFLSDSSVTGTGFIVRIDVIAIDSFGFASLIVPFATSPGSYTKLATDSYYQALIVVTPENIESTFSVDSTDIEVTDGCHTNNLQVYEISFYSTFARRAKLCGKFTSSPASFRTTFPVIALLGDTRLTSSLKVSWT